MTAFRSRGTIDETQELTPNGVTRMRRTRCDTASGVGTVVPSVASPELLPDILDLFVTWLSACVGSRPAAYSNR